MTPLHIGEIITAHLKDCGMTKAEFGRRICCSRQNVSTLLKKQSLSTRWLRVMSEAINIDLFKYYSDRLPPSIRSPDPIIHLTLPRSTYVMLKEILNQLPTQ